MLDTLQYKAFLILTGAMDYNWLTDILDPAKVESLKNDPNGWRTFFGIITNMMYNLFYILGVMFFSYKVIKAMGILLTRGVHEIQINQMTHEIGEPILGLILFTIGIPVLNIIIMAVFGNTINIKLFML